MGNHEKTEAEAVIRDTIEYANREIQKNRKKSRRIVLCTVAASIVIIGILGSFLVSNMVFQVKNPFSAAIGFFRVVVMDAEYAEIQKSPRIVLAQPDGEVLIRYMEARGFTELKEEQMGAMRVFTNGSEKEWVIYSVNDLWSKWSF